MKLTAQNALNCAFKNYVAVLILKLMETMKMLRIGICKMKYKKIIATNNSSICIQSSIQDL